MLGVVIFALFSSTTLIPAALAQAPLDPVSIPKFVAPLVIPPAMPLSGEVMEKGKKVDFYEIAVRQFQQQVLPAPLPATTVWSYGSINHPATFHYPAFTIEARVKKPVRVKWINDLKDQSTGAYLPHLLRVDQTLHWANPGRQCLDGSQRTDCAGFSQLPYSGPVPIVSHVHGAHVGPESDGFPTSWYLPAASNIPSGYATRGSDFEQIAGVPVQEGAALFQYPNDQKATTLWYHDHALGLTRLNVYAGPAGFYLLRGGGSDLRAGVLPGPAPALGDPPGKKYYEIPLAIQDRSFNEDGSLSYPDNRAFFEALPVNQLKIPFIPEQATGGRSDIPPVWNPEFFGNTMVVNGKTWPYLEVEPRQYRFRMLNGSDSRFLILSSDQPLVFWQIGSDGGFLPRPVSQSRLLMGPAERADVIVDFSSFRPGSTITLLNLGPDEPFGGGAPGIDFPAANPETTGKVMQFRVVPLTSPDSSTNPANLKLPAFSPLGNAGNTRQVSLNEADSATVLVTYKHNGGIVYDPTDPQAVPFGPSMAMLGTVDSEGMGMPMMFDDPITENPALGATEIWEISNFTMDAHPIHLHQVQFQVVNRQNAAGELRAPEPWEKGFKDTVIAYPDEITRIKAKFDLAGKYVWHCHILSHEDNEMMRPFYVGPMR
ncbi:MAG: bilirubin oxidase [Geobacteraceae bacterium GWC2_58_44]|nr:MAG: bilirubin oxidase [Geobacteraceae bacterium GWC2_58_44]HBG07808.1 bilirubin oxidase [Geobacter sp.]